MNYKIAITLLLATVFLGMNQSVNAKLHDLGFFGLKGCDADFIKKAEPLKTTLPNKILGVVSVASFLYPFINRNAPVWPAWIVAYISCRVAETETFYNPAALKKLCEQEERATRAEEQNRGASAPSRLEQN